MDPVDGTKDFAAKDDEFTTNIALSYKHEIVVGVITAPATGDIYFASKGNGAFKIINGVKSEMHVNDKLENLTCLRSVFHTTEGEKEMFEMQLELGKNLSLPVIVHSRDGFEDTLDCIKNVGYHNGIIHCYSYGYEEALKFLDLGWYISFAGSVTYTKKSKLEDMNKLLKCIPEDRILCETDSPYLAPVPHRGTPNSPYLVQHVYEYIAPVRGTSPEKLSEQVDSNIKTLFKM